MIPLKVSVPAKLTLFGEWAVLDGQPAIATALDKRFQLILDQGDLPGMFLQSDEAQFHWASFDRPVRGFFEFASQLLKTFVSDLTQVPWNKSRASFERGWPLNEGLGSSSAVVATLGVAHAVLNNSLDQAEFLFRRFLPNLKKAQGGKGSGLDLATQLVGGTVILKNQEIQNINLSKPDNLWVIHTGHKVHTKSALAEKTLPATDSELLGKSVREFLLTQNWKKAMDEHHQVLQRFGVVPKFIQDFFIEAKQMGWIEAAKTVGAGGGDAILLLIVPEKQHLLADDIKRRGWWHNNAAWNAKGFEIVRAPLH